MQKFAIFVKKIEDRHAKNVKYRKDKYHCHYTGEYRGASDSIYDLKCDVPKNNFHNGSKYVYHFIIKELAEEFEK